MCRYTLYTVLTTIMSSNLISVFAETFVINAIMLNLVLNSNNPSDLCGLGSILTIFYCSFEIFLVLSNYSFSLESASLFQKCLQHHHLTSGEGFKLLSDLIFR